MSTAGRNREGPRSQHERGGEGDALTLEVLGLAKGGDGVAHVLHRGERRAVFVPRSAPGDVLEAEVDFQHKPARARVLRVLQPSPSRVVPPCPWVERCGGCDLMHVAVDAQARAHADIVSAALAHALGLSPEALPTIVQHQAPSATRYRTRARLAVLAGRGRVTVGYRRQASHAVEPIAACIVLAPQLDAVIPLLNALFVGADGEGEASVALGASERPVLDLKWSGHLPGAFFAKLEGHVAASDLAGAEVWLPGARQPARIGDPRAVTVAADGAPLVVPSGGFAQAHPAMNHKLSERLLALTLTEPGEADVLELFAGSGNFTVLLARHARSVVAVEANARAVVAARANLEARSLRARVIEADADAFAVPPGARTVVLDPPRAGALGAMANLRQSRARRVAYVSCDPATLARDVARLAPAFELTHLETFEMFPQTSHVESLAVLERSAPRSGIGGREREA